MRPITKEDNAKMLQLGYEELENIEQMALEWFNRAGEIRVEKYIQKQFDIGLITDENGIRFSWGEITENPKGVRIFIKEYPPRLKQYSKTKFSAKLGYGEVRETWRWLIRHAITDVRRAGYTPTKERMVVVYKYHFKQVTDPDNMNAMFLTDILKDSRLIDDDNANQLITIQCGKIDPENPGTEIILLSENEFRNHPWIAIP